MLAYHCCILFFFFKQKTAYEMRISDWSSDVCSSDLFAAVAATSPTAAPSLLSSPPFLSLRISASAYMSTDKTNQSWGGRFSEPVDAFVARFTASVEFDKRLYRHDIMRSEEHTSELQSLMRISYAVFCLKKKTTQY